MPFQSQAQERFLYAKEPNIAKQWQKDSGPPRKLPEYKAEKPKEMKSPWMGMEAKPKKEND